MATLTIRNLDDETVAALKAQAKAHGRSLEAEVRQILAERIGGSWRSARLRRLAEEIAALTPPRAQTDAAALVREDRRR